MARQDLALSHGYSNAIGALFALALLVDGAIGVMAVEKSGHKGLKRMSTTSVARMLHHLGMPKTDVDLIYCQGNVLGSAMAHVS